MSKLGRKQHLYPCTSLHCHPGILIPFPSSSDGGQSMSNVRYAVQIVCRTPFMLKSAALKQTSALNGKTYLQSCLTHTHHLRSPQLLQQRQFFTDSLPTALVPPVVFVGLLLTLWTYKCTMTVIFQDKIIYMPYMPPFARSEKLEDYTRDCQPVQWSQTFIRSLDGTKISLCIGEMPESTSHIPGDAPVNREMAKSTIPANEETPGYTPPISREMSAGIPSNTSSRQLIICYFQGNGASLPPRTPFLSNVLKAIAAKEDAVGVKIKLVALSYRGYWTSSGRASEAGIKLDSQAMLRWVSDTYGSVEVILWGQSIGAGVACAAAADVSSHIPNLRVAGMVLETPFTSIKSMLIALYPQKWLPYKYLWPFLWNHWDTEMALRRIATKQKPRVLLLTAKRDEVVPPMEADKIEALLRELDFNAKRIDILGSLHTEATTRREGQRAIAEFVSSVKHAQKQ